jgi:hypothetical protein
LTDWVLENIDPIDLLDDEPNFRTVMGIGDYRNTESCGDDCIDSAIQQA